MIEEQYRKKRKEFFEALIKENKSELTKTIAIFTIDELGQIIDRIEDNYHRRQCSKSKK